MSHDSRQDGEMAWQKLAAEIVSEREPARILKLAKELNEALEKQRIASKSVHGKAKEPET